MACCDYCGSECLLPFTCQHRGGAFCTECRLPPAHQCAGIASWKKKPAPGSGYPMEGAGPQQQPAADTILFPGVKKRAGGVKEFPG